MLTVLCNFNVLLQKSKNRPMKMKFNIQDCSILKQFFYLLTDKVVEVIKRATSLAVLIRHGNKVRGRDAKWPQSGGGGTRGNAY